MQCMRYPRVRLLGMLGAVLLSACISAPPEEFASRAELDAFSDKTLKRLLLIEPEIQQALTSAVGYMVVSMQAVKVPAIGRGRGMGVVVDNRDQSRSYVEVSQFEAGGGLGVKDFSLVILFEESPPLDKLMAGRWHYRAGIEAEVDAAEQAEAQSATIQGKGFRAFRLSEGAAVFSITIRAARIKPLAI